MYTFIVMDTVDDVCSSGWERLTEHKGEEGEQEMNLIPALSFFNFILHAVTFLLF